jgi:hypothetical protein
VAPEPEGSSPHSQQPASDPYPEPRESTPPPPSTISLRSILIPSTPWSFKWSLSFGPSHQKPVHVSPLSQRTRSYNLEIHSYVSLMSDICESKVALSVSSHSECMFICPLVQIIYVTMAMSVCACLSGEFFCQIFEPLFLLLGRGRGGHKKVIFTKISVVKGLM